MTLTSCAGDLTASSPCANILREKETLVHIITPRRLCAFVTIHPTARPSLATWERIATAATWGNLVETRADWPTADQVGRLTVFNIGGNEYRLVTYIDYRRRKVFIRAILTHADYDKGDWKHDEWY